MRILSEDETVDELGALLEGTFTEDRQDPAWDSIVNDSESRAAPLSKLERAIIKDFDQCPLCIANTDPRKVPVHPNCHCDIVTSDVETGQVSSDHRLLSTVLDRGMNGVELIGAEEVSAVQLTPETVAVFDPENMRFADLQRWLEQMQPVLETANTYVSIVVDDDTDEALQETEEVLELLATDLEAGLEALQTKKFWLSIAKAAV